MGRAAISPTKLARALAQRMESIVPAEFGIAAAGTNSRRFAIEQVVDDEVLAGYGDAQYPFVRLPPMPLRDLL